MDEYRKYEPIFGDWYLSRLLGRGSFGKVFEITREEFGETYKAALKVISVPQDDADIRIRMAEGSDLDSVTEYYQDILKGIVNENRIMSRLKGNSNIVSYEDHQIIPHEDGIGYDILIRMELLTPLTKLMSERDLTEEETVRLGIDICKALELCHKKNIIHRDIKPQNIFISDNGYYKLGDFGIARTMEKTSGMSVKGTYRYMAPEVFKGEKYDSTADIYSLGLVLYSLLNGKREPFLPPHPAKMTPNDEEKARMRRFRGEEVPAPRDAGPMLAYIIQKACAYEPSHRYRTAKQMRTDLENYLKNYCDQIVQQAEPGAAGSAATETVADSKPASGSAADAPAVIAATAAAATERTPKKKKLIMIAAACVILCVIAGIAISNASKNKSENKNGAEPETSVTKYEIDLRDLMVEPKIVGTFNGAGGVVGGGIDEAKKEKFLNEIEDANDRVLMDQLLSGVETTFDGNDDPSNGDVITITQTYDKDLADQLGVKVTGTETKVTIQGLKDMGPMAGTWEYIKTGGQFAGSEDESYDLPTFEESEIILSDDGECTISADDTTVTGQWKVEGDQVVVRGEEEDSYPLERIGLHPALFIREAPQSYDIEPPFEEDEVLLALHYMVNDRLYATQWYRRKQ